MADLWPHIAATKSFVTEQVLSKMKILHLEAVSFLRDSLQLGCLILLLLWIGKIVQNNFFDLFNIFVISLKTYSQSRFTEIIFFENICCFWTFCPLIRKSVEREIFAYWGYDEHNNIFWEKATFNLSKPVPFQRPLSTSTRSKRAQTCIISPPRFFSGKHILSRGGNLGISGFRGSLVCRNRSLIEA